MVVGIKRTINMVSISTQTTLTSFKKSRGSQSVKTGIQYEQKIWNIIKNTTINGALFNTQKEEELAGSSSKKDIECNLNIERDIGIECKASVGAEFIQMDIHKNMDNKWIGPKLTKKSHPQSVIDRYLYEINKKEDLFYGSPPQLKQFKTREEFDKWEEEFIKTKVKMGDGNKKEYTWYIDTPNFIAKNYKEKGNLYIQIKNKGLYYLETDVCNFGVPKFNPIKTKLRIRCKRRGKQGCIPSSLTVSAWIEDLENSPYSLDNIETLPPNLISSQ